MRWLCWFRQCDWQHVANAQKHEPDWLNPLTIGLYQCTRCKTLSIGVSRNDKGVAL